MRDDRVFILLLVTLVVGLIYLAPPRETPPDPRIAQLEGRVDVLQRELNSRKTLVNTAVNRVATRKQSSQVADTVIRMGLNTAKRVLADTTTPPDTLRAVLMRTVEKVERYQGEVLRYQEAVDSLLIAHAQERQAFSTQIDTLTALVQAQTPTRCAIWGVPCPNRTTAFWLGVGSAFVVAFAVAF